MRTAHAALALAILAATPLIALAAENPLFNFGSYGAAQSPAVGGSQVNDYSTPAPAPVVAESTSGLPLGIDEQVSVTMTPQIPKPGQTVRVRIDSYSTDLNKAATVWLKNGQTASQGIGIVEFTFVAPAAGESVTVTFRAQKVGGGAIEKSVTVTPADVDILYEAQTYTPPLYRGKAMFTNSASIKFVAVPNVIVGGARVDPKNLVYTWRENGQVVQSASGYGRQTFTTRGALVVSGVNVEVEVETTQSPAKTKAYASVNYASPALLLYRKDPLLGVLFERSWSGARSTLAGTEFSLAAVPYFVDVGSAADARLTYAWRVNGEPSSQVGSVATFRKEGGGVASVSTQIKHAVNFAQHGASSASVDLGESAATAGTSI